MAYIEGSDYYDKITGTSGSDTINARKGNDYINDYGGNDVYIFNIGDEQDTLYDATGNDEIRFGSGINSSDLQFFKSGNNLIIRIKDTVDKIDIKNWFSGARIETLTFANGSYLTASQVENLVDYSTTVVIATAESDVVYGA